MLEPGHTLPRWKCTRGVLLLAVALLGGCGSRSPQLGVLVRASDFSAVVEAGMAIAPVVAADPRQRSAEISALMSGELFATLFVAGGEGPLVSPAVVQAVVEGGGEANTEFLHDVRRRMIAGERPQKPELVRLSRVVQHRFLFLSWYDESTRTGVESGTGDYRETGFASEVGTTAYSQVIGRIEGVVLDLWEGTILWRAAEEYRTDRLYGARSEIDAEIERARAGGATRLAGLFDTD